nr:MAG TPA: hypothetical protein [Caudoviricetes sp.]DAP07599.1 MAG TPA: hypothetical protein [Caudoviricetes sp.]DAW63207.1 MAG TPA: hypothetical protein [Caudoviricetes sp.]
MFYSAQRYCYLWCEYHRLTYSYSLNFKLLFCAKIHNSPLTYNRINICCINF